MINYIFHHQDTKTSTLSHVICCIFSSGGVKLLVGRVDTVMFAKTFAPKLVDNTSCPLVSYTTNRLLKTIISEFGGEAV